MKFSDRVAIITGSAQGIGAATARAFAQEGAKVVVSDVNEVGGTALVKDIAAAGGTALFCRADVGEPDDATRLVQFTLAHFGRLDVLVNNAGIVHGAEFIDLAVEDFDRVLRVNLRGAFLCAKAAMPLLRAAGGGRIINFCDWVAASGRPRYKGYVAYYVAKAGVKALTEALALELAADGILVNAIAPGPILAPPDTSDAASQAVEQATPLGRWGGSHEIVKAVLALIDSDFITGETLRVDGGRHLA